MRLLKSNKSFFYCVFVAIFFLWSSPNTGYSAEFSAEVKQVDISLEGNSYLSAATIVYHLSDNAKSALQNGVPLFWNLHFKIQQHRDLLWNTTLQDNVIRYRIQYNALLNMYRVRNETSREFYSFSTLASALELMSTVINFPVINKTEVDSEKQYLCLVKVEFDRDSLPLPLRPIAYIDPQWYLSSNWTLWPLKK